MHNISGHSEPHVFHFFKNADGVPVIRDKAFHTSREWSEAYQLLSSMPSGEFSLLLLALPSPHMCSFLHAVFLLQMFPTPSHHEALMQMSCSKCKPIAKNPSSCALSLLSGSRFIIRRVLTLPPQLPFRFEPCSILSLHTAASQLDNSLTCFQTHVQVAARRNPQDELPFTFTAGLWVAVRPDEDKTMDWQDHHSQAHLSHCALVGQAA